jgi:hypothetical protein
MDFFAMYCGFHFLEGEFFGGERVLNPMPHACYTEVYHQSTANPDLYVLCHTSLKKILSQMVSLSVFLGIHPRAWAC